MGKVERDTGMPRNDKPPRVMGLFVLIVASIGVTEMIIMLVLELLPFKLTTFGKALLDSSLLTLALFPLFLLFFFRPFSLALQKSKELERTAQEERERYLALAEISPDCIKLFKTSGELLYINPGGLEEHGLKGMEEAKRYDFKASIVETEQWKFEEAFDKARQGITSTIEFKHTEAGSNRTTCLETLAPVKDAKGRITRVFGVSRDISEIKRLEEIKEALGQMVVHDLRGPLSVFMQSVQLLQKDAQAILSERQKQMLAASYRKAVEMSNMVSDLLDIGKMEEGKFLLDRECLDVGLSVKELVNEMGILAPGRALAVQIASEIPKLYADPQILRRILSNLIGNALKFSNPESPIEIELRYDGQKKDMILSVKNEGRGIPEEYRDKIFDKYVQVQDKTAGLGGKGLGLTFCKMAVEAHGGRIWVESEVGKSATFYFTIPVVAGANS